MMTSPVMVICELVSVMAEPSPPENEFVGAAIGVCVEDGLAQAAGTGVAGVGDGVRCRRGRGDAVEQRCDDREARACDGIPMLSDAAWFPLLDPLRCTLTAQRGRGQC